ncbi:hypothetical protein Scep_015332 [Stephania cephalantha]|uniref:Uncharacterized protein n=1 Tax=Stephania cephalantha TaxID=152367 RepID=A0AAP0J2T3_9MAGN
MHCKFKEAKKIKTFSNPSHVELIITIKNGRDNEQRRELHTKKCNKYTIELP